MNTVQGGKYLIYVVSGSIDLFLQQDRVTLLSIAEFSGTLRLAKVYEESQEQILDAHAETYPLGVTMSYEVNGDQSIMNWEWDVVGDPNNLLVLSWPHHRYNTKLMQFYIEEFKILLIFLEKYCKLLISWIFNILQSRDT